MSLNESGNQKHRKGRSAWLDLLRELGYRLFHGVEAFAQFEPPNKDAAPVDLMFVEQATWKKLIENATEMELAGERVLLPWPEYLVALKLHAAMSPTRSKPEGGFGRHSSDCAHLFARSG